MTKPTAQHRTARNAPISRAAQRKEVWSFLAPYIEDGESNAAKVNRPLMAEGAIKLGTGVAHKIVKRGVSSKSVEPLGRFLGIGKTELAKVLDLDRGTPSRLAAKNKPLPSHAGEGVVRLLELESLASDVFESEDDAADWLRKPHPMLEGEAPLEAAGSSFGTQRVKDILLAIKYGAAL